MSTLEIQAVPVPFGRRRSGAPLSPARARRWRGLLGVAVLVAVGHALLLGGVAAPTPEAGRAGAASPLNVRVVAAARPAAAEVAMPDTDLASAGPAAAEPPATADPAFPPAVQRTSRARKSSQKSTSATDYLQAGARSTALRQRWTDAGTGAADESPAATVAVIAVQDPEAAPPVDVGGAAPGPVPEAELPPDAPISRSPAGADGSASGVSAASGPTLLLPGEEPPPTYRTRLPPALTLRYEVRSGFLRGSGELRWRPQGEAYSLALEARLAGLALLRQSSEGELGSGGLAPARFVDQRARRSPQAANFRRDAGKITFSGPATEWPLLPGSQDRLSFFVQLAGIAAADPALRTEGARIVMVVAGARGDASVWTFRCLGAETIETGVGTVHAIKFVRDARSAYDTTAEIWLDPARHHLPAHATLRNRSGAAEVDLLLEGLETVSP